MEPDAINELLQFLKPEVRLDLKFMALDFILGTTNNTAGVNSLIQNETLIESLLILTSDINEIVTKNVHLIFVNLTASGAKELLKNNSKGKLIINKFLGYVLDPQSNHADSACMVLSNITRLEDELNLCIEVLKPHLNDLLSIFVHTDFNKKKCKLHYLAPMFSNLSRSGEIRKWLIEENHHIPLIKLLPFCNYELSSVRRGGALSTVRNLTFSTEYHEFLLKSDIGLLTYLLSPLMGNEDYDDEEMDMLPLSLQYLPKEKQRDPDIDIRKIILEILNLLCTKRSCREILRSNGVYYVLREYHKWEKSPAVLLACENVVDILIRKEEEIGIDDISAVTVPEDMTEKFVKMDEEFVNNS